jgi:hypothetical protein
MVPSISFSGRECRHADKIFAFPARAEFSVTTSHCAAQEPLSSNEELPHRDHDHNTEADAVNDSSSLEELIVHVHRGVVFTPERSSLFYLSLSKRQFQFSIRRSALPLTASLIGLGSFPSPCLPGGQEGCLQRHHHYAAFRPLFRQVGTLVHGYTLWNAKRPWHAAFAENKAATEAAFYVSPLVS